MIHSLGVSIYCFISISYTYIPGSVHLSPMYPSAQLHVLLATQAPCSQGGSQVTITIINIALSMYACTVMYQSSKKVFSNPPQHMIEQIQFGRTNSLYNSNGEANDDLSILNE